ncbi:MAG: hypothetical protein JO053_13460 [Acidobacteria bacterium]|nr:hypothetical protein [Acidobacteriota bacterium]
MSDAQIVKRGMLRHFLAAIAYRTQKALRDAPEGFAGFDAGGGVRTPHELICHMLSVLGYARTYFIGGEFTRPKPEDFKNDVSAFHEMLGDLSRRLKDGEQLNGITEEILLQGPFADVMTHAGQLAMLRRLHERPVPSENFIFAKISADNVSMEQPQPERPDLDWSPTNK